MPSLHELGWTPSLEEALRALRDPNLIPARVSAVHRDAYHLQTEDTACAATLRGRLRHQAGPASLPVVGDWVAARLHCEPIRASVEAVLPRSTLLVRKHADRTHAPQPIAANVDTVFIVTSLNRDFNLRRIERGLALVRESGAEPVVVLSKVDLCTDPSHPLTQVAKVAHHAPVHALSTVTGEGLGALSAYLVPGRTVALLGSSGVGKSTLANALLGTGRMMTRAIRAHDDRGRHATTHRELFALASGALLVDTPGMRELGLWDADEGLAQTFEDVECLIAECRFSDCMHGRERGCAVQAAIVAGALSVERFASYQKLARELAHEARRGDPEAQRAAKHAQRRRHAMYTRTQRASPKRR